MVPEPAGLRNCINGVARTKGVMQVCLRPVGNYRRSWRRREMLTGYHTH
jgi:hypothetical protein